MRFILSLSNNYQPTHFQTTAKEVPPFLLYAPRLAALKKPEEGEKESLPNKAYRRWQEEEREAREKTQAGEGGYRAKFVGVRLLFCSKGRSSS